VAVAALTVAAALSCRDAVNPAVVASVDVTSPIGDRLAVGRDVQLTAVAHDAQGNAVTGVVFTWNSSPPGLASVSADGQASGLAAGTAAISAGSGSVSGQVAMRVIAADLDGISVTLADPFAIALIQGLTDGVRTRVETALNECGAGIAQGNFTTIEACFSGIRAEAANAADPTDVVLLGSLSFFLDHATVLLNA
jgi:hypothetical protein